jgi:hypothetical protein
MYRPFLGKPVAHSDDDKEATAPARRNLSPCDTLQLMLRGPQAILSTLAYFLASVVFIWVCITILPPAGSALRHIDTMSAQFQEGTKPVTDAMKSFAPTKEAMAQLAAAMIEFANALALRYNVTDRVHGFQQSVDGASARLAMIANALTAPVPTPPPAEAPK